MRSPRRLLREARRLRGESGNTALDGSEDVVDLALGNGLSVGGNLALDGGTELGGGILELTEDSADGLDGTGLLESGLLGDGVIDSGVDDLGERIGLVGDSEGLREGQAGDSSDLGVLGIDLSEDSLVFGLEFR